MSLFVPVHVGGLVGACQVLALGAILQTVFVSDVVIVRGIHHHTLLIVDAMMTLYGEWVHLSTEIYRAAAVLVRAAIAGFELNYPLAERGIPGVELNSPTL
jgi:hypothetical protein